MEQFQFNVTISMATREKEFYIPGSRKHRPLSCAWPSVSDRHVHIQLHGTWVYQRGRDTPYKILPITHTHKSHSIQIKQ